MTADQEEAITCKLARDGSVVPATKADENACAQYGLRTSWPSYLSAQHSIERVGLVFKREDQADAPALKAKRSPPGMKRDKAIIARIAAAAPKREEPAQLSPLPAIEDIKATHAAPINGTREAWLLAAVEAFRPWFTDAGEALPQGVRVSVGWPRGSRKAIGQAWPASSSADGSREIFISPVLVEPASSYGVLATLLHELCHAALPAKVKHSAPFQKLAHKVGLVKPWTATTASPETCARLNTMSAALGPYPHAAMNVNDRKKQGTRLLKASCLCCGYTVRMTAKWLEHGAPHCATPHHGPMVCD